MSPEEVLVVVPSATDVARSPNVVKYRVAETYPAPATVKAITDAINAKACVMLHDDPFNPPPGFKFGDWEEHKTQDGGTALIWFGAWQCSGAVVTFSLASQHEEPVKVAGAYITDAQVREIRKKTRSGR